MEKRCSINESFLEEKVTGTTVDHSLPFRIQKRQLLRNIGFPIDNNLKPFPITDAAGVAAMLECQLKSTPFIIVVSEKPISTLITPLFIVTNVDRAVYRDKDGNPTEIIPRDIPPLITQLPKLSWVEFTKPLWDDNVIAGRLLHVNPDNQILEAQKGTDPNHISPHHEYPYYVSEMTKEFGGWRIKEIRSCRKQSLDNSISKDMWTVVSGFRSELSELAKISPLPTLEFAYTLDRKMAVIDVDWPQQWVIRRR